MNRKPIFLHNLKLACSVEFEKQFESFLRDAVTVENEDLENAVQMVSIRRRTIHVGVHNTWKNLGGQEKMINLEEPDRMGICQGSGTVELNNYIEDPLIALTFRVEFEALLPVRPVARPITHTVAWQIVLPKINELGQVQTQNINMECKIGNQVSLQNDLVWGANQFSQITANHNRSNFKLQISAQISTDRTGKEQPQVETQTIKENPAFPFANMQADSS